eukprot:gene12917-17311_t
MKANIKKSVSTPALNNAAKPPAGKQSSGAGGLTVFKAAGAPKAPKVYGMTEEQQIEFVTLDPSSRSAKIADLIDKLSVPSTREFNCYALGQISKKLGILSEECQSIINVMINKLEGDSSREIGIILLNAICKVLKHSVEPFVIPLVPRLLSFHADKSQVVRDMSASIGIELMQTINSNSFRVVFPMLTAGMVMDDWRIKVGSLNFLKAISPRVSRQLTPLLPQIIPLVSECIHDSKKQVQTAAMIALEEACLSITNDDIRPLVPLLVSVIARPDESSSTLDVLLETTFVAQVDAPVLALIAPLLGKCLKNRASAIKRKASRVIDIMCRLVQDPSDVAPFLPMLLPSLDKVIDELVDAEVCEVAKAARAILLKAVGEGNDQLAEESKKKSFVINNFKFVNSNNLNGQEIKSCFVSTLQKCMSDTQSFSSINALEDTIYQYVSTLCTNLLIYATTPNLNPPKSFEEYSPSPELEPWRINIAMTKIEEWNDCVSPFISDFFLSNEFSINHDELKYFCNLFRSSVLCGVPDNHWDVESDDASLCNIEFSLAFGGKILLHNTYLRLGKGRRYGLMGKNGAGKTTLLTNIGSGNIEGLPTHLRMIYVQHDDRSDDLGVPLIEELLKGKDMIDANVAREEAVAALKAIHFTDTMLESPRSLLSGGWKMKLLIIKAMLAKADVLLLDEPTNHLDKASVAWLTNYILSQHNVTCLIVSHDTAFMDHVLTDVIHYEEKKLVYYHGNLTHFVEIHPEAKYYYDLESSNISFKFPVPERLDGINSTTRSILKMEGCDFTYPGSSSPQLTNINVKVCLASRIAVIGANGAGKSTLIKLLVQETEPDENKGTVWKHMNLRVAYVAQHSFHHVEQHLDMSPVDYIKWRFSGGVDKEDLARPTMKLTEEEIMEKKEQPKYGDVDQILGRRKNGRTMEYECTFIGQNPAREPNKYITVEKLIEMGHLKLVQQCDTRIAAMAAGLDLRPLVIAEIQAHLDDFNLESEYGTHSCIRRLSGGQKVKLVLAAAMWNRPHVLVLDEPTNYLDRQALGALTQAIKEFGGGVVIISHNAEFTDAICTERWVVKDGTCYTSGEAEENALKAVSDRVIKKSQSLPSDMDARVDDAGGNINKSIVSEVLLNPKTLESLSKKEIRKLERCAQIAGVTLKDYLSKINCKSPEWKWL